MENHIAPGERERLSIAEIKNEVFSYFYLEKGLLFTFIQMFKAPKFLVDTYLFGDRLRVYNPFRYLFYAVAASTVILIANPSFRKFIEGIQNSSYETYQKMGEALKLPLWETMIKTQEFYMSYQNIVIILSIPAAGWITWKLFNNKSYNYAENMAINSLVFGTTYWVSAIIGLITYFMDSYVLTFVVSLITIILGVWFYYKIFQVKLYKAVFGILLVYIPILIIGALFQLSIFVILLLLNWKVHFLNIK